MPSWFNDKTFRYLTSAPGGFKGFAQSAQVGHALGFKGGLPFVLIGGALAMASAPRGQAISKGVAAGTGFGISSMAGAFIGGALTGGNPIGAAVGALAFQLLGGEQIDRAIAGVIQPMVDFGTNMRRHRFGGDYRDTQVALSMRQAAAREMSRSLMNARQWLGAEASFMAQ